MNNQEPVDWINERREMRNWFWRIVSATARRFK